MVFAKARLGAGISVVLSKDLAPQLVVVFGGCGGRVALAPVPMGQGKFARLVAVALAWGFPSARTVVVVAEDVPGGFKGVRVGLEVGGRDRGGVSSGAGTLSDGAGGGA